MPDFLPAGRTPPSVLLSSESAAARASMGGWCRPCGVRGTVLWACQSCWRQQETCWRPASASWHRSEPVQDHWTCSSVWGNWITVLAAVNRLSWLWLGVNGRTCLWTAPSPRPASAAPCAWKKKNRWLNRWLWIMEMQHAAWNGGFDGVGPFFDALMHFFVPVAELVFMFGGICRAKEDNCWSYQPGQCPTDVWSRNPLISLYFVHVVEAVGY